MFSFASYKKRLLNQGVVLNTAKKVDESIPSSLHPVYEYFDGMADDYVENKNSIELYSMQKAIESTKQQLIKHPKLKGKLGLIFGDVLLESQFLAIQTGHANPQYLFDDKYPVSDKTSNNARIRVQPYKSSTHPQLSPYLQMPQFAEKANPAAP